MNGFLVLLLLGACQLGLSQNITDVPICAQTCLANATSAQTECTGIDVKCLCTNSDYVNALSCCLATSCAPPDQQRAIAFNIASCTAVNESAPNFVGCSPGASSLFFDTGTLTSLITSATTLNSLVTTVTGPTESVPTTLIGTVAVTAPFNGRPLLTGTCSQPYFARITDSTGMITQYPQIGCTHDREGCCPFDSHQKAVVSKCPQDYFTTANACCPSGWEIYTTDFAGQTPCYTMPTVTLVPEITPTVTGLTLITEGVFTRRFELSERTMNDSKGPGAGAIAGIVVGSVAGLTFIGALVFLVRRRKIQRAPQTFSPTAGDGEMVVAYPPSVMHELGTPQGLAHSPESGRSGWGSPSSPPAYEHNVDPYRTKAGPAAQELPGSTFILEHHPAYAGREDELAASAPSPPPRTPGHSPPFSSHARNISSPQTVSPVSSPKQR